jgi:hypothetical protein
MSRVCLITPRASQDIEAIANFASWVDDVNPAFFDRLLPLLERYLERLM